MKKLKKLKLNKSIISMLNPEEAQIIHGGTCGETSYTGTCGCSQNSFMVSCKTYCSNCGY